MLFGSMYMPNGSKQNFDIFYRTCDRIHRGINYNLISKGLHMRITRKVLERQVAEINQDLGFATEAYTKGADGKYRANVGTYVLNHSGIYGGYEITQLCNEGGGCREIFYHGRVSAKEMHHILTVYREGLNHGFNLGFGRGKDASAAA